MNQKTLPLSSNRKLRIWLAAEAEKCGFEHLGIAPATLDNVIAERLWEALERNHHGTMTWLFDTASRRESPDRMWAEARSAIVLAMNYTPDVDPMATVGRPTKANISVYARNRDYHELVKGKLKEIAGKFGARTGAAVKVFVDTAPLMEKPLAVMAGLGWQGKHTNLVSRESGSWLFLGVILTDMVIEADSPEIDHCGTCRACLDQCPTQAFVAPYKLDARRCISYLTIEHKGMIAPEFRKAMGNRIYGCDDCLAVCPWNKFASASREIKLQARKELVEPDIAQFLLLDDPGFRTLFSGSPVKRIGRNRFMRNVLIAAGNSGQSTLKDHIRPHLRDEDPHVRAMAVWALKQLLDNDAFEAICAEALSHETDETVIQEWKG